ncbi:Putative zn(2)-C6 fungal-type DNA-binding domain, fungal transcription factor [Septoria linicola]|uniref:Zn(2)-C6 fungal-type DNA-binding domain, fungal transcription factor n=1 Tax=Septoria linicola TaxID=215465 RepID=A0A9Q9EID7_9PEZI|nr:putative zn(2)-C6 fungal-type DNA-binding domain, fungal transcription factor [Septoria linicola]USW52681.1 Putative zn(2)-C6 fungal-type DNA-binding domain, fungal transcription factor [Septoria linicola]
MSSSAEKVIKQSAPGYHVFSVRTAGNYGSDDVKAYTTRKSHRKSRIGCDACKQKRVKCDEKRPACGRCEKSNAKCDYRLPAARASRKGATPVSNANSPASSIASEALSIPIPRSMEQGSRDLHLLKHYDRLTGESQDTITCSDLLVPDQSREYRMAVLRLAQQHTYLLHGILSIACLHLDHHQVPGFRIAKLSHFQEALSTFQDAINKPIVKDNADPILLAGMMINMQYFCYVDSVDPLDSWVFSGSPSRLDWLSMQMGLTPLVHSTTPYHSESLLRPVWHYAAYIRDGSRGLPPDMLRLCGIHKGAKNLQRNPYWHALQSLAPLMLVERETKNLIKYLSCLSGFNKKFFARAQVNDHIALLILAYWFGLMCYVDFWWYRRRVLRDTTALCMYLEAHGDERIRALLDFPAEACHRLRGLEGGDPNTVASKTQRQEPTFVTATLGLISKIEHKVEEKLLHKKPHNSNHNNSNHYPPQQQQYQPQQHHQQQCQQYQPQHGSGFNNFDQGPSFGGGMYGGHNQSHGGHHGGGGFGGPSHNGPGHSGPPNGFGGGFGGGPGGRNEGFGGGGHHGGPDFGGGHHGGPGGMQGGGGGPGGGRW